MSRLDIAALVLVGTVNKKMRLRKMDRTFYVAKLEKAESDADNAINQGMAAILEGLTTSINILRTAKQLPRIDIEQVVTDLNAARDEWLAHAKETFDTRILALKESLAQHLTV